MIMILEIIRRSKSGRLPSVISHLNGADDTMDSRISQETSRGEEIYSAIPENVFFTPPLKHSTQDVRTVFQSLSSRQYRGDKFVTLPAGTRPQLQSTPQEPHHLHRLNIYAIILEFPSAGSPRPAYRSESPRQFSPSLRKNFLYASHRAVPGSSPFINSVKVERPNSFSINKVGLPNTSRETSVEVGITVGSLTVMKRDQHAVKQTFVLFNLFDLDNVPIICIKGICIRTNNLNYNFIFHLLLHK